MSSSIVNLHRNATYLSGIVKKSRPQRHTYAQLTIYGPDEAKVGEWVRFYGTSPPGVLRLYSQQHPETKPFYPYSDGVWVNHLWFSVRGEYIIYIRNGDLKASHRIVIK